MYTVLYYATEECLGNATYILLMQSTHYIREFLIHNEFPKLAHYTKKAMLQCSTGSAKYLMWVADKCHIYSSSHYSVKAGLHFQIFSSKSLTKV